MYRTDIPGEPMPNPANRPQPATDRALDVIEHQTAVLVRHFELLYRRGATRGTLDRAEYLLLRTLAGCGPMDINTLAAALGVDPSTAGRQVGAMRGAGLVAGEPDPADRRRTVLTPTGEGLRRMDAVRRDRTGGIADLLADWSEADLATLGEMFRRYNRAVAARYLTAPAPEDGRPAAPPAAGTGRGPRGRQDAFGAP